MAASPWRPPPITLICICPGFYEDENEKLWMVVSLGFRDFHPTENRQYSKIFYWGKDSTFWQLVDHIQIGNTEQLILRMVDNFSK
ncbi:protein TCL1B1-like [Peromyscus californicus insignis]|uniref:protein TCL1B1-like n=1 Tax=Peromyscus californicus insignis TaxID=564181 RepID=UPI0022A7C75C|nr:protein TCL1B1-like [Peromyscus californicus insignis]